jgi:hypothetical protein
MSSRQLEANQKWGQEAVVLINKMFSSAADPTAAIATHNADPAAHPAIATAAETYADAAVATHDADAGAHPAIATAAEVYADAVVTTHVADYHEAAPNSQTGATYTFAAADARRLNIFDRATAQTVTIPANATVAFPIGTTLRCLRDGAGLVTFTPAVGVTLNKPTGIKPNRFMGAVVKKAADETTADYSAAPEIPWTAEDRDTDGFHDNVTNNTRLTIPANLGIKSVDLSVSVVTSSHLANEATTMSFIKNGAAFNGGGGQRYDGPLTTHLLSSSVVAVPTADADYFEVEFDTETDTSITILSAFSAFRLKVTEIDAQGTITYQHGFVDLLKIGTNEWTILGPGLG